MIRLPLRKSPRPASIDTQSERRDAPQLAHLKFNSVNSARRSLLPSSSPSSEFASLRTCTHGAVAAVRCSCGAGAVVAEVQRVVAEVQWGWRCSGGGAVRVEVQWG